jgi:sugar phosphate permease
MITALGLVATGVGLTTLMRHPWQLVLLWGLVVGGGTGMTALALGATVVNRWFSRNRGLVMGVLTTSTATGQLIFLPSMATAIERYGWRPAMLTVSLSLLALVPFIAIFVRDHPHDVGLKPYGDETEGIPPPRPRVSPFAQAIGALRSGAQSSDFWLLFASFFICGASTNGLIGTHLIPACVDHGIPEVRAASLLAVMGIFDLVGTTVSGWFSDRWNNRYLLCWYYSLRGLALVFLPYALEGSPVSLGIFAVFYGLDWIATVPPTVRLIADIFGRENVGMMFGWIVAGHQMGAALAAFAAGAMRTSFGNYVSVFIVAGMLCLVAALLVLRIGGSPRRLTVLTETA